MELIAAIDVLGGRTVRLVEGNYSRPVEGAVDPRDLATRWASAGLPRLHVVDLDGARSGGPSQFDWVAGVVAAARAAAPQIRVQAGGGLRSRDAVAAVLSAGADAAVLGTAALERPGFLAACAGEWPGQVLAALDLRDGDTVVDGWLRTREGNALDAAHRLLDEGAAALLVTDTRRDGTLSGPNVELLGTFRAAFPEARLVAAGGIRSIADLLEIRAAGLDGAIVGMAILTRQLDIGDALAALAAGSPAVPSAITA